MPDFLFWLLLVQSLVGWSRHFVLVPRPVMLFLRVPVTVCVKSLRVLVRRHFIYLLSCSKRDNTPLGACLLIDAAGRPR